jgi:peptidyl-prolyl cis-trans isomerase SurA
MKRLSLKIFFFLLCALVFLEKGWAQNEDKRTLVTIGNEPVSVDEFLRVYKKNNVKNENIDQKSLREYLDLYIKFKLKVMEAEAQGLDTVKSFKDELNGYRKQLVDPYFVDEKVVDDLYDEVVERRKEDIRASHILIMIGPDALPEDTLAAYKKIMAARERIMKGEDFGKVAVEVSEDPSARDRAEEGGRPAMKGNRGDLGYFTAFDMVYPFENAAYKTKLGEVSQPIRTDFGYHLVKVTDRKPAMGTAQVAHLYLQMPKDATAQDSLRLKQKADSIYDRILKGDNFEELVKKLSDDKGSANRGGVLPPFTVNRMVPEFIVAVTTLKDTGQISKPVLTSYGWHIIKLISRTGIKPADEVKNDLKKRIKQDKRSEKSRSVILDSIKKEYGFSQNDKALKSFYELVDSSFYKGEWVVPDKNLQEALFTLGNRKYTQKDFAEYLVKNQKIGPKDNLKETINKILKAYIRESCLAYEDSRLEDKHPDFRALMKEYRDGILLFELTDDMVWTKAVKDTSGLKEYYAKHRSDYNWGERLDATIYTFSDPAYADAALELVNKGMNEEDILKEINKDSLHILTLNHRKFSREDNKIIDQIEWKPGVTKKMESDGKSLFVKVHGVLKPEPKSFDEARGLITADYQNYLEDKWIKELKEKYPVKVDEAVFSSIKP